MWPWFALTVVATAACGSAAKPKSTTVSNIRVDGNQAITDEAIERGLDNREPSGWISKTAHKYDSVAVDADARRIESLYQRHGYFSAEVMDVDVERTQHDTVRLRYRVSEGPVSRIGKITVRGADRSLADELRPGDIYDYAAYVKAKRHIVVTLRQQGYARARVAGQVVVDRERHIVDIQVDVDRGPVVRFGDPTVVGLVRVPRSAVLNRLAWAKGDPVTPARLAATRARIYRLGLFSFVGVDVDKDTAGDVVHPTIRARESRARELRAGIGVAVDDSRFEARLRAGHTRQGFIDPLTTLSLDAIPSYALRRTDSAGSPLGGEVRVELSREDFLLPRLRASTRAHYRVIDVEGYTQRGPGGLASIGRPMWGDSAHLVFGWQLDSLTFADVHPALAAELAGRQRVGFFHASASIDRRDDLLDAHRGYYLAATAELGSAAAGGSSAYTKGLAEARGYVAARKWLVVAGRARFGRSVAGQVPIVRRYFAGGAASHRGFAQRRLSPFVVDPDAGSVPVGGQRLLLGSAELRFDTWSLWGQRVGVATFVDAGDVTESVEPNPLNVHIAVGGGLRYPTPVGPLRLDVGVRVNRSGAGEPDPNNRWALHLSLGEAF